MTQRTREVRSAQIQMRLESIRERIMQSEPRLHEIPDVIFANDSDLEFFLRHSDVPFAVDAFIRMQLDRAN